MPFRCSDAGETFWTYPERAAFIVAGGWGTLRDDSDAVISAVAAYADDHRIMQLVETTAAETLVEAWRRGLRPD